MEQAVLLIDGDAARRRIYVKALQAARVPYVEGADTFHAMGVLGRAEFACAIMAEERRHLAMRGFLMLAKKRHPSMRSVVLMRGTTSAMDLQEKLVIPTECFSPDTPVEEVVEWARRACAGELSSRFLAPTESQVVRAVHAAVADDLGAFASQTVPDTMPAAAVPSVFANAPDTTPTGPPPLMDGALEGEPGSALIMGIQSQELTGRLVVDQGNAAGTLYFLGGNPVAAVFADGDASLFTWLHARNLIPPDTAQPDAPEGLLLSTLASLGLLAGDVVHNTLRELVRQRVLALCGPQHTPWRFVEDRAFVDTTPLIKVNTVGLLMEATRRSMTPDRLFAESLELAPQYIIGSPALGAMGARLKQFTRGRDVGHLLGGTSTVEEFCSGSGLDNIMGTMVVLTLRDARLLSLSPAPASALNSSIRLMTSLASTNREDAMLLESDLELKAAPAGSDTRARDAILGMYARLKPLHNPHIILGAGSFASPDQLDAALQARLAELTAFPIPAGPEGALLSGRQEELRRKLDGARQALRMQEMSDPGGDAGNPF